MKVYFWNPKTGEVRVIDTDTEIPPSGWFNAGATPVPQSVELGLPIGPKGDESMLTFGVQVETVVWEPYFGGLMLVFALVLWLGARS